MMLPVIEKLNVPLELTAPFMVSRSRMTVTSIVADTRTPLLLSVIEPPAPKPAKLMRVLTEKENVPLELTAPLMLMVATRTFTLAETDTPVFRRVNEALPPKPAKLAVAVPVSVYWPALVIEPLKLTVARSRSRWRSGSRRYCGV